MAASDHHPDLDNVALIGSYVPRQCGIATFTKDLHDAIADAMPGGRVFAIAMDDVPGGYAYPEEVRLQIRAVQRKEYVKASDLLNISQVDVAIVQHEFGIYGGPDGSFVIDLIERLRMPVMITLHTVLAEPSPGQAHIVQKLAELSDRLIVMSHLAERMLRETYRVPAEKIAYIPHGIPDVPFVDPTFYKDQFGLEGRTVLLTFGLLSPSKGIEVAIKALPAILAKHPAVVYVVLGATHPHVLKNQGNAYHDSLERLADKLGVKQHVVFHNRFVSIEELCGYIGAADLYIVPYLNKAQITSGTLAYAIGAGKAVVSTPFWYAEEMCADGQGALIPFNDSQALADAVNSLLGDDLHRNAMRKKAYTAGREMIWPTVGQSYLKLAHEVLAQRLSHPRPAFFLRQKYAADEALPDVNLNHLVTFTDDTGVLQHAVCAVPDRNHGYCTDDNARALVAVMMYLGLYQDDSVYRLVSIYLSFLHHAFHSDSGRFRNFMSFDRRWLEEAGSEDCHGRALWGLGLATALAPNQPLLSFTTRLFHQALVNVEEFTSPRAWALALVGIHAHLRRFGGDTFARRVRGCLAQRLFRQFQENATADWPWCEDTLTYGNAKLVHALLLSGQWMPDRQMVDQGLRSLEWLLELQTNADGALSLIGNQGWYSRGGARAYFDQQPIDAMALVEACAEAFRCTQDPKWCQRARQCLNWFLGNNDTQTILYDYETGGCRDGLNPDGANLNQGAESTLAWLISLLTMHDLSRTGSLIANQLGDLNPAKVPAVPQTP